MCENEFSHISLCFTFLLHFNYLYQDTPCKTLHPEQRNERISIITIINVLNRHKVLIEFCQHRLP